MNRSEIRTVAVVEDNPDLAASLGALFESQAGLRLDFVCHSAEDFLAELVDSRIPPNVVLVDLNLPRMSGQELIATLRRDHPSVRCVAHTIFEDRGTVLEALRAGAAGYLVKGCSGASLVRALGELEEGGAPLTPRVARMLMEEFQRPEECPLSDRENEVLILLSEGLSYKGVSHRLTVSVHTVHSHIKKIYEKLEVNSKRQAVQKARSKGWIKKTPGPKPER